MALSVQAALEGLHYSIFDPTGNITALVESPIDVELQPAVANALMARHQSVEQVGFVSMLPDDGPAQIEMRMAGGEFCGNATMSTAALYLVRSAVDGGGEGSDGEPVAVLVAASGAQEPVEVRLACVGECAFDASVHMPSARAIEQVELSFGTLSGRLPVVRMEGISHVVIEDTSEFFGLLQDRVAAEAAVRAWCGELGVDGLGLMFLEGSGTARKLTPLVYVPGSDTVFWENSCASGSSAVGMYAAAREGELVALDLAEPGGILKVQSDPASETTWLLGKTRLVEERS